MSSQQQQQQQQHPPASPSHVEQGRPSSTEAEASKKNDDLFTKAIDAKLPNPIKSDVKSWIALAQTIAVTSALFAAVQISLNQLIESAISDSGGDLHAHPVPVWRGLRWFMYSAVIINLGCAGSAVAVINMAASLECDIGYMATKYYRQLTAPAPTNRQETKRRQEAERYKAVYEWVATNKLTGDFFNHKADIRRLQQFGIGKSFGWITWSMTFTFIVGGAFIFLTFLYWVALTQVKAAIALMAVAVALALGLTLSFLLY